MLSVGGTRVASGAIDVATLITFLLYIFYLIAPIQELATAVRQYQTGAPAVSRHPRPLLLDEATSQLDAVNEATLRDISPTPRPRPPSSLSPTGCPWSPWPTGSWSWTPVVRAIDTHAELAAHPLPRHRLNRAAPQRVTVRGRSWRAAVHIVRRGGPYRLVTDVAGRLRRPLAFRLLHVPFTAFGE